MEGIHEDLPIHGLGNQALVMEVPGCKAEGGKLPSHTTKPQIDIEVGSAIRCGRRNDPHQPILLAQRQLGQGRSPRTNAREARSSGIPLTLPDRSYVQAWYGQENTRAVPDPSATLAPRCRHTFKKARSLPSRARTMRIGTPRWSSVRKAPGGAHSEAKPMRIGCRRNRICSSRARCAGSV